VLQKVREDIKFILVYYTCVVYLTWTLIYFPHVNSLKRTFTKSEWYFALLIFYTLFLRKQSFSHVKCVYVCARGVLCVITLWKIYRWWTYDRSTSQRAMLPDTRRGLGRNLSVNRFRSVGCANEQRAQIARPGTCHLQSTISTMRFALSRPHDV